VRATSATLLALALLAAAGQALAQSPATPAAEPKPPAAAAPSTAQPPERPAAPRAPLILRLDEIDGPKPTFAPSESERPPSADLPSLGGDARAMERAKSLRSSPYPHSSENLQ
jgi:hypothetical protein